MWPSVAAKLDDFFNSKEGKVRHMYPDILGYITTGVGYLIDSPQAAQALPWKNPDGSPASADDVANAWAVVDGTRTQPKGVRQEGSLAMQGGNSKAIQSLTTIRLSDADVENLFLQRMHSFESTLKNRVPAFDKLPADGQLLLLSMAWALGPNFHYPKFFAAVNSTPPDFVTAGHEATWNNENADRRAANALLAANAATAVKLNSDPSILWYPNADVAAGTAVPLAALGGLAVAAFATYKLVEHMRKG